MLILKMIFICSIFGHKPADFTSPEFGTRTHYNEVISEDGLYVGYMFFCDRCGMIYFEKVDHE